MMNEEKHEVKKSEIIVPLLENFKKINNTNAKIFRGFEKENDIYSEDISVIKNNVSAMCEIANTLNNIFGTY